ncbi:ogr/Delta-like zinc finger family protein [Thalassospira profundimaris]|uniref:ogr/Delta-like zinc finger family protein n=1 Tax=Thalassospira profundimaris TaxID=502049 RepID=UPI000DEDDE21|nr:ogr/Delta-like zinc finger family protein [Thalassospira profundimaris]
MSALGNNSMKCPHCGSACGTVKTRQVTSLYREITLSCKNPDCLHVFIADMTAIRTLRQSLKPAPGINLAYSTSLSPVSA